MVRPKPTVTFNKTFRAHKAQANRNKSALNREGEFVEVLKQSQNSALEKAIQTSSTSVDLSRLKAGTTALSAIGAGGGSISPSMLSSQQASPSISPSKQPVETRSLGSSQSAIALSKQDKLNASIDRLTQSIEKMNVKTNSVFGLPSGTVPQYTTAGGYAPGPFRPTGSPFPSKNVSMGAGTSSETAEDKKGGSGLYDSAMDFLKQKAGYGAGKIKPKFGGGGRGLAGMALEYAGGVAMNVGSGILNYQSASAGAAVDTYANMSALKGFQEKRFLRNFSDFSAESLILRSPALVKGSTATTNLIGRVDSLAMRDKQSIDTAQTNQELKNIATSTAKAAFNPKELLQGALTGALMGGVVGGPIGALIGGGAAALGSAAVQLSGTFASSFDNNTIMRNKNMQNVPFMGDLYLKNRTGFDAQVLTERIGKTEDAIIQNQALNVNNLNKYMGTMDPRFRASQSGRYFDVLKEYANAAPVAFGDDEAENLVNVSKDLKTVEKDKLGREKTAFKDVLIRMQAPLGGERAEGLMTALSGVGGAGAGNITAGDAASLERVRKMSISGRGSADQLLSQATLLGRLSGGVSVKENTKQLEEVLSRAVAIGMDNSDLGQAFVQNVANVSGQMKTADIDMVSKLVQNMQSAGGGQLVDFQRMERSINKTDQVRQENLGVKTYTRENIADFLSGQKNLTDTQKSVALQALTKFDTKDMMALKETTKKYQAAQSPEEKAKILRQSTPAVRNLLKQFDDKQIGELFSDKNLDELQNAMMGGLVMMTTKAFTKKFKGAKGLKADKKLQTEFERVFTLVQGGDAGAAEDLVNLITGAGKVNSKRKAVSSKAEAEAKEKSQVGQEEANRQTSQNVAGYKNANQTLFESINKDKAVLNSLEQSYGMDKKQADVLRKYQGVLFDKSGATDKFGGLTEETKKLIKPEDLKTVEAAVKSLSSKTALQATVEQTPVTPEKGMAKGDVMSEAQAKMIGSKFAEAFFEKAAEKGSTFQILPAPVKSP